MKNKLFLSLIIFSLLLRILLSAFTYHADVQFINFAGFVLSRTNVFNFYDYLFYQPNDSSILKHYPKDYFIYPPAVYLTLGVTSLLLNNFVDFEFNEELLFEPAKTMGDSRLFFRLFLLKMPYLLFDGLIILLLYNLFDKQKDKILASILWILNPINLYATYMMGQFDIIAVFFVLLSLYLLKQNNFKRLLFSALVLGLGGAFKIYPLFLLLPLASMINSLQKKLLVIGIGLAVYILPTVPFLLSAGYKNSALLAGQPLKSLYAQIPISGGESIILFLTFVGFFSILFLQKLMAYENSWQRFFLILLVFFTFTHFHPQWFLWLTPFFILDLIYSNFKNAFLVLFILFIWLGQVLLFEPGLNIGLFAPLSPGLINSQSIWQTLNISVDINFSRSILQSALVACFLYYFYLYFPRDSQREVR